MNSPDHDEHAEGTDQRTGEHERRRRAAAEQRIGARGGDGQRCDTGHRDQRTEDAPLPRRQSERVVEIEVQEQRDAEEGEAQRRHAGEEEVEAADLSQPFEGHADRDRQLALVRVELGTEHGAHLVAAPSAVPSTATWRWLRERR